MRHILTYIAIAALGMLSACREDEYVDFSQEQPTGGTPYNESTFAGMYLLNEGNLGSNHCTLDYLDFSTSIYHRNIYGQRNPSTVKELGDVGNDIKIYGSKLWMVINASNKIEVTHASNAKRIGQVNIPNCRYLAFHDGFAYVSSYVGPIHISGDAQLGRVYKVDTLSLQAIDSVVVGYQPEEMAIIDNKLYVANSGGYRYPNYDNRISCIDLEHFAEAPLQIEVGINLHHITADKYGKLWVTSRGNYADVAGSLYCLAPDIDQKMKIIDRLDIPVANMQITGDTLWYLATQWDASGNISNSSIGLLDIRNRKPVATTLFDSPEIQQIATPYSLIVHPYNRDFYITDARNYVSSGRLLHFSSEGYFDWCVPTGDIPSSAVFVKEATLSGDSTEENIETSRITVLEYRPAPGQFINALPLYEKGDDAITMALKCTEALNNNGMVCLGGFGGSITFRFDHPIYNRQGLDFRIFGNSILGNSEAGIVEVSVDTNGNGLPDDEWYELAGSADTDSIGLSSYGYEITYDANPMGNIPWSDNKGNTGEIARNSFHTQEYFPQWLSSPLVCRGTRLPNNAIEKSGQGSNWYLNAFRYGYVDNLPDTDLSNNGFDLDWAVHPLTRQSVSLQWAHFVRVYTGLNQSCGWLGETSTEITGAKIIE